MTDHLLEDAILKSLRFPLSLRERGIAEPAPGFATYDASIISCTASGHWRCENCWSGLAPLMPPTWNAASPRSLWTYQSILSWWYLAVRAWSVPMISLS